MLLSTCGPPLRRTMTPSSSLRWSGTSATTLPLIRPPCTIRARATPPATKVMASAPTTHTTHLPQRLESKFGRLRLRDAHGLDLFINRPLLDRPAFPSHKGDCKNKYTEMHEHRHCQKYQWRCGGSVRASRGE